jgi:hypothetical protein
MLTERRNGRTDFDIMHTPKAVSRRRICSEVKE